MPYRPALFSAVCHSPPSASGTNTARYPGIGASRPAEGPTDRALLRFAPRSPQAVFALRVTIADAKDALTTQPTARRVRSMAPCQPPSRGQATATTYPLSRSTKSVHSQVSSTGDPAYRHAALRNCPPRAYPAPPSPAWTFPSARRMRPFPAPRSPGRRQSSLAGSPDSSQHQPQQHAPLPAFPMGTIAGQARRYNLASNYFPLPFGHSSRNKIAARCGPSLRFGRCAMQRRPCPAFFDPSRPTGGPSNRRL